MGFIAKLLTRFRAKPAPVAPPAVYLESEFTVAMLEVARKRTAAEQAAREAAAIPVQQHEPSLGSATPKPASRGGGAQISLAE